MVSKKVLEKFGIKQVLDSVSKTFGFDMGIRFETFPFCWWFCIQYRQDKKKVLRSRFKPMVHYNCLTMAYKKGFTYGMWSNICSIKGMKHIYVIYKIYKI